MDHTLHDRAARHYTGLIEQGVNKITAGEHTRQRFGLTDEQLRYVMAHNFMLISVPEGDDETFEGSIADLMAAYATVVNPAADIPYYGD